jgi:hypothetical protein
MTYHLYYLYVFFNIHVDNSRLWLYIPLVSFLMAITARKCIKGHIPSIDIDSCCMSGY